MIIIVNERLLWREELLQVKRMRQWVLDAEHILSGNCVAEGAELSNTTVGQRFDTWQRELAQQLTENQLSPLEQQCLEQFLQVLTNQRCHLIQCYDQQSFPRTNNEMERQIRRLKTDYRRISGRKNWNSYLLRYGRCVAYAEWWEQDAARQSQFFQQAAQLDRASWRKHRRETRTASSEQLKRFRFRHKRHSYLASLEARWATAPTLVLP